MTEAISRFRPRRLILFLVPCALLEGILSALRWPQRYAMTHMVIDYHFGFGKRGLIGSVMPLIDKPPYHYLTLAEIAFAVFVIAIGLLVAAAWRNLRSDAGVDVAFILFFLSTGFSSLVCDVGRGEHFGFLLAAICLFLPVSFFGLLVRAALLTVAVFIQELNFLVFALLIAVDAWAAFGAPASVKPCILSFATLLPAAVATCILGSAKTACDASAAVAYFQHMVRDFQIVAAPVRTLCIDGRENFAITMRALWSVGRWAWIVPLALLASLPSTIFNLWVAARLAHGRWLAAVFGGLAALSPLALLLVAVDVVRFVTLIQLTSLMLVVLAGRRFGLPQGGTLPPALSDRATLTALAAVQLGTSLTLNDGSQMLKFPFQPLVIGLEEMINGHADFLVIPPD